MVNHAPTLDGTFQALGDPIRRSILEQLAAGEQSVTDLASQHAISLPGFLKHIRILEETGLITTEKIGRVRQCRVSGTPLLAARAWIDEQRVFWERQLDSLQRYLDTEKEESPWPHRQTASPRRSKSGGRSKPLPKRSTERGRKPQP